MCPRKKKCMKIVQDLPWNTEDLKSGREHTDATSPCLVYQKRWAKSSTLLKTSKWLHNPEPDCQDALPAFAWSCPSVSWSLPRSAAAVSITLLHGHTHQHPLCSQPAASTRCKAQHLCCLLQRPCMGMCSGTSSRNTPLHGEPTSQTAEENASFLSIRPEPHQCQHQLRVMCKMSTSFLKSASGKCKNLRAAV